MNSRESKVILDAEGTPVEIRPYPSNVATRMIEDFMLMANETVAEEYCTREIPSNTGRLMTSRTETAWRQR